MRFINALCYLSGTVILQQSLIDIQIAQGADIKKNKELERIKKQFHLIRNRIH